MTVDSEGSGDPARETPTGDAPATDAADSETPSTEAGSAAPAADDEPATAAPDDLKAKYREALAHKQGSHGATNVKHGDQGSGPHGSDAAHGHRMFRRKSGG